MSAFNTGLWVAALLALAAVGCGRGDLPELGEVHGTVTMGGKPLANVMVQFYSEAGGRPGTGVTDAEGNYELTYVDGAKGAKIGPNKVEISTIWPDGEPTPGEKEKIPSQYNSKTSLKKEVQAGDNEFSFDLDSTEANPQGPAGPQYVDP